MALCSRSVSGAFKKQVPGCNVMSPLRGQTHVSSLHCFFFRGLRHQHIKGADGSRYQSIYEPTEPSQPMMSDDVNDNSASKELMNTLWAKVQLFF